MSVIQTKELWTEKLRPRSLEKAIIVPRIREELKNGVVDNILLYGTPGAGKTTLTRILCAGHDYKEINASLERGIDTIRDVVMDFACASSLMNESEDGFKIVVLEECDNLTPDAWKSLRALMEKTHNNCRFIANCNYIDKIPEPIQSRFNCISIDPVNSEEENYLIHEYIKRVTMILGAVQIQYTPESVEALVKRHFPDMRSIVKKIQQIYTRGVSLTSEAIANTMVGAELFKVIIPGIPADPYSNYEKIAKEYSLKADEGILEISRGFVSYMHDVAPQYDCIIPDMVIAIANYVHQLSTALDKLVVLEALIYTLQTYITNANRQLGLQPVVPA